MLRPSLPVAVVFARELTPEVTDLLKKLDAATARRDDLYARWENASEELAAGEEEV